MSSNSSMGARREAKRLLLHLVEHPAECCLHAKCLLDLVRCCIRIFPVFQKAWTLVLTDEFDEGRRIRFPVHGKTLKILEHRVDPGLREKSYCILRVLIEVGIEYALIHEVSVAADVEEYPAQIMQLQRREESRVTGNAILDGLAVPAHRLFSSRLDLRDDGEAVIGRCSWI